ncbi:DUF4352 domain-containing protein [Streptomyces triticagri]|uniref:DUF4352 domain-containing protein n=1 Tax=Streptomyces triticagri TaxID=2293568 RepID=A0A372MDL4_9ACTN|nr:DUF4352 domain-containing protein [Streptomyces triticagri]RFU88493.1 DUF4352 domain-containing protein [Streptomyces triticagri]
MRTKTLTALAVPAVLAVALLTGCSAGSDITTKPEKPAGTAEKAKDKKPAVAKVGDTIALKGMEDGSKLDVTVTKVVDNAKAADEFTEPQSGNRFYGVQFKLTNTGSKAYDDSPSNGVKVADAEGQQFDATIADITAGPSMAAGVKLSPGAKGLGWIVFEVPTGSKITTVQFAMDSGFSDQTGEWKAG